MSEGGYMCVYQVVCERKWGGGVMRGCQRGV